MAGNIHRIAKSKHPTLQVLKRFRCAVMEFTIPLPHAIYKPFRWVYVGVRNTVYYLRRILVCEPLFKGACAKVGKRVRTDIYIPFIMGHGELIVGDDVLIDGMCVIRFAARFRANPRLVIGNRTHIGHNCILVAGKEVIIGDDCLIAGDTQILDSSGHHVDPKARLMHLPPDDDMVKPVRIGNNVWVGKRCMIFPGVTIGDGSVVAAGSHVIRDVAPNTLVSGNPARAVMTLGLVNEPAIAPADVPTPACT